jgi:hypothetical protein
MKQEIESKSASMRWKLRELIVRKSYLKKQKAIARDEILMEIASVLH